jgi:hypothetical protein
MGNPVNSLAIDESTKASTTDDGRLLASAVTE